MQRKQLLLPLAKVGGLTKLARLDELSLLGAVLHPERPIVVRGHDDDDDDDHHS